LIKEYLIQKIKKSYSLLVITAAIYSLGSYINFRGKRNNNVRYKGAFLKNTQLIIKGKNNRIEIGRENRLTNCRLTITGNNCEVFIGLHCILANTEIVIEDDGGKIKIGNKTTIEGAHIAATEGKAIEIGEDCMLSYKIEVRSGDSHPIFDSSSKRRINNAKSVFIGDHVWVGSGAKILKGAFINNNSIIGTGSIITGVVEEGTVYAGIPARKLMENIEWKRERKDYYGN
jgi:acetyltransferase-like isoleucine patch superfamily enzyme